MATADRVAMDMFIPKCEDLQDDDSCVQIQSMHPTKSTFTRYTIWVQEISVIGPVTLENLSSIKTILVVEQIRKCIKYTDGLYVLGILSKGSWYINTIYNWYTTGYFCKSWNFINYNYCFTSILGPKVHKKNAVHDHVDEGTDVLLYLNFIGSFSLNSGCIQINLIVCHFYSL